jgi:hypothetical protein
VRVLELGGENLYAVLLEECDALRGTAGNDGNRKNGSNGGTDKIGVVEVGERVADYHACGLRCIGTAKDGSQIAGLLHPFEYDEKGVGLAKQRMECARLGRADDGHNALCAAAIGNTLIYVGGYLHDVARDLPHLFRSEAIEANGLHACLQAMLQLSPTLYHEEPFLTTERGLLLECQQVPDARILGA